MRQGILFRAVVLCASIASHTAAAKPIFTDGFAVSEPPVVSSNQNMGTSVGFADFIKDAGEWWGFSMRCSCDFYTLFAEYAFVSRGVDSYRLASNVSVSYLFERNGTFTTERLWAGNPTWMEHKEENLSPGGGIATAMFRINAPDLENEVLPNALANVDPSTGVIRRAAGSSTASPSSKYSASGMFRWWKVDNIVPAAPAGEKPYIVAHGSTFATLAPIVGLPLEMYDARDNRMFSIAQRGALSFVAGYETSAGSKYALNETEYPGAGAVRVPRLVNTPVKAIVVLPSKEGPSTAGDGRSYVLLVNISGQADGNAESTQGDADPGLLSDLVVTASHVRANESGEAVLVREDGSSPDGSRNLQVDPVANTEAARTVVVLTLRCSARCDDFAPKNDDDDDDDNNDGDSKIVVRISHQYIRPSDATDSGNKDKDRHGGGLGTGAKVGIAFAVIIAVGALAAVAFKMFVAAPGKGKGTGGTEREGRLEAGRDFVQLADEN